MTASFRSEPTLQRSRGSLTGFDIALAARPGDDLDGLAAAGATWATHAFGPGHRPDQVLRVIDRGVPG